MDINTGRIIKARLAAFGEKLRRNLFVELNRRGAQLSTVQQLYQYINGYSITYKSQTILSASLKILDFWESEADKNGKTICKIKS